MSTFLYLFLAFRFAFALPHGGSSGSGTDPIVTTRSDAVSDGTLWSIELLAAVVLA